MALSLRASAALGMTELAADTLVSFIQQIVREQVQQTMGGLLGAVGRPKKKAKNGRRRRRKRRGPGTAAGVEGSKAAWVRSSTQS